MKLSRFLAAWYLICAALVGSLFALPSLSATPACYPFQTSAANFEQTTQPTNIVKWLSIDGDKASFVVTYFCDQKYGWSSNWFYGYRRDLVPNWQTILTNAPSLSQTAADSLWTANVTTPDPTLEAIAKRQLEANRPPDIVWHVRANGTQTSRPVFPVKSDGTRGTSPINGERVAIGAQCSCRKLVIEEPINGAATANSYCTVEGQQNASRVTTRLGANRLAWCERVP